MKRVSNYLKIRVLGALEHAPGDTFNARYQAVSEMVFHDEDGQPRRFTARTIQTWWYYYRRRGITENPGRSDKGTHRKLSPEDVLAAIENTLPSFHSTASSHGKRRGKNRPFNIQALYRACIVKDDGIQCVDAGPVVWWEKRKVITDRDVDTMDPVERAGLPTGQYPGGFRRGSGSGRRRILGPDGRANRYGWGVGRVGDGSLGRMGGQIATM